MFRRQTVVLGLVSLFLLGSAISTLAQVGTTPSPAPGRQFGLGIDMTEYPAYGWWVPQFTVRQGRYVLDIGANLHSGEDVTQFALRTAVSVRSLRYGTPEIGVGAQFDLRTNGLGNNTLIGLGGFVEAVVDVNRRMDIELRIYPLNLASADNYTRFALGGVGFSAVYFY